MDEAGEAVCAAEVSGDAVFSVAVSSDEVRMPESAETSDEMAEP